MTKDIEVVVKLTVPDEQDDEQVITALHSAARKVPGAVDAGIRHLKAFSLNDLLFLWNEAQLAADTVLNMTPSSVFTGMTCSEAESIACVFAAAGRQDAYQFIIDQHKEDDSEEELEFHKEMAE